MPDYDVRGFCEDQEGERISLGTVRVSADDEQQAEHAAWQELWDPRLTSAGCLFRVRIEEAQDEE